MVKSINIIDGYPGIGKTTWAIQNINETKDHKTLYITPYLDEVTRIINSCPKMNFEEPDTEKGYGSKKANFIELIKNGRNVVSTHALFSYFDNKLFEALKEQNYVLYLDEALQVIQKFNITYSRLESEDDYSTKEKKTKNDTSILIKKGFIQVAEDGKVIWLENNDPLSHHEKLKRNANLGLIYKIKNTLLWVFPVQAFKEDLFREIYIMTHRFDFQLQSYYFRYYEIPYKMLFIIKSLGKYELTDNQSLYDEEKWKREIRKRLTILEDEKLNEIGGPYRVKRWQDVRYNII